MKIGFFLIEVILLGIAAIDTLMPVFLGFNDDEESIEDVLMKI